MDLRNFWSTLSFKVLLYYFQLFFSESHQEGKPCITRMEREGTCLPFAECSVLRNSVPYNRIFLYKCDSDNDVPKVCCPNLGDYNATSGNLVGRNAPRRVRERSATPPAKSPFIPEDCGFKKVAMAKIVGGQESELGAWPWMAAMYLKIYGKWEACCGGALITKKHVITAAHCLVDARGKPLKSKSIRVRLGEHDLMKDDDGATPVDITLSEYISHSEYVRRTYLNDIAILVLDEEVEFSSQILPVCLPYDELYNDDLNEKEATVIGWGTVDFNGPPSDILLEAEVNVVTNELCKQTFRREVLITDVYLCAGVEDGSKDACRGDSGGPLVTIGPDYRYYLIGVVSFGKFCATPGYPGVYTRVTEFLDWITDNLS